MQIRISDLVDSCPEGVELGAVDEQLTERIKAEVLNKIKSGDRQPQKRNGTRILLLAAVIATLMTATAFAAGIFGMRRETVPAAPRRPPPAAGSKPGGSPPPGSRGRGCRVPPRRNKGRRPPERWPHRGRGLRFSPWPLPSEKTGGRPVWRRPTPPHRRPSRIHS